MRSWAVLRTILLKNQTSFFKEAIFCVIITAFLFLPLRSEAVIIFPYFNLTIVKNTSGGDGDFSFHLGVYPAGSPLPADLQDFNITTLSGTGSHFISEFVGPGTTIYLTENSAEGWQMGDVSCVSSNPLVTAVEIEGGVWINTAPYSSATCTFTNTKGEEVPDPVIIIPGILGSAEKDGVWLMEPRLHTYDNLIDTLAANGYTHGQDLFPFPYDWRNSNVYTAELLKQKIDEVKAICDCNKVDLVGHSMGGLVARQYIQSEDYAQDVDQLIFLGTPHLGSPESYLTWEGGEIKPDTFDFFQKFLLKKEAKKYGFSDLFDYVRNKPITSVKELLPTYDYIRDKDTDAMREYPNNYPVNIFLENLNNTSSSLFNFGIKITNIMGDAGVSSTINALRIVSSNSLPLWEHGYPDGFNERIGDRGLEYGAGDGTVSQNSAEYIDIDLNKLSSEHGDLPTDAEGLVFKKLTNKNASVLIDKFRLPDIILIIKMLSPADMVVIAPDGKRIGKDFATGQEINEIDGAFYSGFNGDDEYITIPNPLDGDYKVETIGTDNGGQYTVAMGLVTDQGVSEYDFTATTLPGMITSLNIEVNNASSAIEVVPDDALSPIITITSPEVRDYLHSEVLLVDTTSTDIGTGVLLHQVSFDGKIMSNGDKMDLFFEKLGDHVVSVTSTDFVGNVAVSSTSFRVIATVSSTISDVERAYSLGWIDSFGIKNSLIQKLQRIKKKDFRDFLNELNAQRSKHINEQAFLLIKEDINWLLNN